MRKEWLIEEEEAREEFKNHVATRQSCETPLGQMDTIHWGQPGHSNFEITYVLLPKVGRLLVYGDLGEAVHGFWRDITYEAIASMGAHRYASKCEASEYGDDGKEWSREFAEYNLQSMIDDAIAEASVVKSAPAKSVSVKDFISEFTYEDALANEFEWARMLCDHDSQHMVIPGVLDEVDGEIWLDFTDRWEAIGNHVARRIQWHRWGIKLALEQLAQKETACERMAG